MSIGCARVLVLAGLCATMLSGCGSINGITSQLSGARAAAESAPPDLDTTASINIASIREKEEVLAASKPPPEGEPDDDLSRGKKQFRDANYGLAERYFRSVIEKGPTEAGRDAEAWLGLAATYDRLKRFKLADRAYAEAIRIIGPTPEVLNNQGYSYLLRGDYRRARETLLAARAKDPTSPFIRNNLELLAESGRR
jgi:Flp pilus assembly protein TadD